MAGEQTAETLRKGFEAFQKGEDIHARTARLVFGAKTDEELTGIDLSARGSWLPRRMSDSTGSFDVAPASSTTWSNLAKCRSQTAKIRSFLSAKCR